MAKAKVGIDKKLVRSTYKNVNSYIEELCGYINTLHDDLVALNTNYWYGGEQATNIFNKMAKYYLNDTKFVDALNDTQAVLRGSKYYS